MSASASPSPPVARTRGRSSAYDLKTRSLRSTSTPERAHSTRTGRRSLRRTAAGRQPARAASTRVFVVNIACGALALASVLLVFTRVLERWRLGRGHTQDVVSLFGQGLSYPAANAGAVVVAALAGFGVIVLIAGARAVWRETSADARFRRAMARQQPASVDGARIINGDRPQAFCAGLLHPRVYLSRGALESLSASELSAVLAHERHHAQRRDPLRLACARVLAHALFFLPPVRRLVAQQHSLAEMAADDGAVDMAGGDRAPLASAMLRFSEASGADAAGLAPERIDYLVGEGLRWRFPFALLLVVSFCLAAFVLAVVLAAETASGSATLALPLISSQPCVVMLALVPAGIVWAGLRCARARTTQSRTGLPATDESR